MARQSGAWTTWDTDSTSWVNLKTITRTCNYASTKQWRRNQVREPRGRPAEWTESSVSDPDWVGSASFCRIRIGINYKQIKKLINQFFPEYFNMLFKILKIIFYTRVSDPHWFNADPDTDPDPDPAFFLIADPDSGSGSRIPDPGFRIRIQGLMT